MAIVITTDQGLKLVAINCCIIGGQVHGAWNIGIAPVKITNK